VFRFGSLQVLSKIPLVVLGDSQGCPRQGAKNAGVTSPIVDTMIFLLRLSIPIGNGNE
jgi:hypothetical protein